MTVAVSEPRDGVPAESAATAAPLSFSERLSDRMNPIFVRELQQAFNAKAVLGVVAAALAATFLIGLMIALRADRTFESGRQVFIPVLMVLTPVMTMVLPMQAFNSMQHELREGAVDQLLMSELNPRRIVRGKLLAAALLAVIFMAAFAPLLAVTYLLRGIDVATIGICLAFSFLFALGAAAIGLAMGAVTMIKPLQQLARVGVSAGLAGLTIAVMANVWDVVRDVSRLRSTSDLQMLAVTGIAILVGVVLMNMIAAAVLTHPHENRSTSFRAFPFGLTAVAYAVAWWVEPGHIGEFAWGWGFAGCLAAIPFFIGAVTEGKALSPRVRTLVPRNRALALLAAPFLPGSDRGLLFVLVFGAGVLGAGYGVASQVHASLPRQGWPAALLVAGYVWIWVCVLRILRGEGRGQRPRVRAIIWFVLLFALACAGPAVWDLSLHGEIDDWSWPHVLNPFFTFWHLVARNNVNAVPVVLVLAGIMFALRLKGMIAGVREVLEASRARAA